MDVGTGTSCMLEAMREGSKDAACFLYWILSEEGRTERMSDVMDAIDQSVGEGHPRSMLCMADALSKGVLVELNEEKAIGYARVAYRSLVSGSEAIFTKLLWKAGTDEMLDELMAVSQEQVSRGNLKEGIWYARVVIRRKDFDNGFEEALSLLDKAIEARVIGARAYKVRLLWEEGSEDSCREMVKAARPLVNNKHDRSLILVGKAYLYGKGVKKDPSKALKMFEEAEKKNPELKKELEPLYRKARASKDKQSM